MTSLLISHVTLNKLLDLCVLDASSDNHFTYFKVKRLNEITHIKNLVQHLVLSNNSVSAIIIVAMMFMLMQPSCEEAELRCL